MFKLSFIYPALLWLLLVLIPLWGLALAVPRRLPPWRFYGSLLLRSLLILVLVLSLAGTQLVSPVNHLTTVFLLDGSDSVTPSARGRAETFVQEALRTMSPADQAAIVVFGENALVERAPSTIQTLGSIASVPTANRTDLQEAIQLGLALFPADAQKRLVLLSDGGENTGQARSSAQLAAAGGVPIEVIDLAGPESGGEALVARLEAPSQAREGQESELVAVVESTVEQSVQLRIFADDELIVDQQQNLTVGSNRFTVRVSSEEVGFRRYRVQIDPQQDGRVQNNEAAALVHVQGPPRVLLIANQASEARNLLDALQAAQVQAEVSTPADMPHDLAGLSNYEAVVLVNVPAREMPVEVMRILPGYVRDLGKGLIMIGGDESFGVGGYGRTPLEEALPVYMDVRDRQERPNLALVFVIDKSGSMDACHCANPSRNSATFQPGGERKVDIAKEAVIQASALLSEQDTLGIVTFDSNAYSTLPATRGASPDAVADAVAAIDPNGSTNVYEGLQEAEAMLNGVDARIKHVILLTDGWGGSGSHLATAERMREQGMTLTVVAAGSGSAEYLDNLATAGGGRYYPVEDMSDVPQIFLQETITAVGNYIVEHPFVPAVAGNSPILDGFTEGFPGLSGYNGSTLKETARAVLVSDDQSPILAQWQYGLGRSVAWTSDAQSKWARNWVRWDAYPRFAAQMVGWVVPQESNQNIITDTRIEGPQTIINVMVQDNQGDVYEDLQMTATIIQEDHVQASVPLMQVGPGSYRTSVSGLSPGTYLVQLAGQQEGRTLVQDVAGLVIPYSPEYRQDQHNPTLLADLMRLTGGRPLEEPEESFAHTDNLKRVSRAQEIALPLLGLALLLLPLDIAIRRLLLRRADLQAGQSWLRQRFAFATPATPSATPDATLTRLAQAKRRATRPTDMNAEQSPAQTQPEPQPRQQATRAERPVTPDPSSSAPPVSDAAQSSLERLREAKERARRRARGEE